MSSSGLAYWTIFWNNFGNGFFRILNSNKYESEKHKELTNHSQLFYMILKCITIFVNSLPNISLRNAIWTLFILDITISEYLYLLGYIRKISNFILNGIQITGFFGIPKKNSYLSIFSLLFSKKELENNKNTRQKIFANKIITISSIIFVLLFLLNIADFKKLYKRKQQLSLLNEVAKFLKNPKNYPIVPLLWLNDNEIICNVGLGCENESIDQGRSYYYENINISNCYFARSSSYSGEGGVICVNGGTYSMNINYSMFYNCVCSSYGGAIYFYSSNSSLRMICANSCSASYGHFSYLWASQVNQVEYLSVSNCSHTTSGYYPIYLNIGYQRVDNTNSSMNNAIQVSGICIWSPSSFTSSHCTFSNNKVSNSRCIYCSSFSGIISMSYANIVHNNSPSQYGVVYVSGAGARKMMYCIFKNNQNTLFCVNWGSLEVSHSFIYHSASFSTLIAVSTSNNNSFTNAITYQLQFFNDLHCNADMPFEQRNPEETPMNTPEDTPMNTPEDTPLNTPEETPMNTPEDTPMNTPEDTPLNTPEETPMNTPEDTPMNTPEETPMNTPEDTPMNTPEETPMNTPKETPMNTPEETPMNTPKETTINSSSANSLILGLVSLSVIVLLICVIYILGLIPNSKQESSNMSSSDGNFFEKV